MRIYYTKSFPIYIDLARIMTTFFLRETRSFLLKLFFNESLNISGTLKKKLNVLEELILSDCWDVTNAGVESLLRSTGPSLRLLYLANTDVSLASVSMLDNHFPVLNELNLFNCSYLTNTGIVGILSRVGDCLKVLNLGYTAVTFSDLGTV